MKVALPLVWSISDATSEIVGGGPFMTLMSYDQWKLAPFPKAPKGSPYDMVWMSWLPTCREAQSEQRPHGKVANAEVVP